MKVSKYIVVLSLLSIQVSAKETTWKNDIDFQEKMTSNIFLNGQIETEMNFDGWNYEHLQFQLENKTDILSLAPGFRFVDRETKDSSSAVMMDIKANFDIMNLTIKNRLRYIYEFLWEEEDSQVYRYRIITPIKLVGDLQLTPGAEVFVDQTFNYKRMRYSIMLGYYFKRWQTEFGYEYNDNHDKENNDTIVTEIGFKF